MIATMATELFGEQYEIQLILKEEGPYRLKLQFVMNDVIVEETYTTPQKLRDPGKILVDWLHSRYRGQFTGFSVECR